MAPLLAVLSSFAASLVVASVPVAASDPDQLSVSTTFNSTQSAAGFMFDMKAKANSIVVFGLDVNLVSASPSNPELRVLVYTKEGSHTGFEDDESAWNLWLNATIESYGMNGPTPIPQSWEDAQGLDQIRVPSRAKQAFYVAFEGPYLRYSPEPSDELHTPRFYYQDRNAVLYGEGTAKRKGWKGGRFSPRTFNGAVHYHIGEQLVQSSFLPDTFESDEPTKSPSKSPTMSPIISPSETPSISTVPTITTEPTNYPTSSPTKNPTPSPTKTPTKRPTKSPTDQPTGSPVGVDWLSAGELEDRSVKPTLMYAGNMFDLKGRDNIEISTIGFNTWKTEEIEMSLYIRDGGYKGAEDDLSQWEWRANVTVTGEGMGRATYLPQGSFEPIILRKQQSMGFYLTTNGPYMRASKGDSEGKPEKANGALAFYQGVGKRFPIDAGTISPRIFQGTIGYVSIDIPSPSPTMDVEARDLWVRNMTLAPEQDTFIQKGKDDPSFGKKAQLMVDGSPKRVSLLKFDLSALNGGQKREEPTQILSVVLRLYAMTGTDFGGYVSIIPDDDDIDVGSATWDTVPYGEDETGTQIGEFRSVWPSKLYEMDITHAFRDAGNIPNKFLLRISSDRDNGIMYRSSAGNAENGPRLFVKFAYDPDTKKELAKVFGSDEPTQSPTVKPEWDDAVAPRSPNRYYFNYNPGSSYGPNKWHRIAPDGYYGNLKKLKTNTERNRCTDGKRQSPRNLCAARDECLEFHETRNRAGQYGLTPTDEPLARPTPDIMHNKLRLIYKERRSEAEEPIPPGADFARNGQNSGIQDLVNIDIKVRSEHRLCGKQYDAEMQQFYVHQYGNLEAISVLIEANGEHNAHFQIMLDFFQVKFDGDAAACKRRQRRARALLAETRPSSKLRGVVASSSTSTASMTEDDILLLMGTTGMDDDGIEQDLVDIQEEEEEAANGDTEEMMSSEPSLGNILYQRIRSQFPSIVEQRRELKGKRWDPLKPWDFYKSVHFWGYSGSTTEPPCLEDVKWRVTDVPMQISPKQYIQLKKLMFDHVDPNTCRKTSTHYEESNARPVPTFRGGATYRCRRSDYASDVERLASGRVKGFVLPEKWWGVDDLPYVTPEFPNV